MKLVFNPFTLLVDVFNDLYPGHDTNIMFCPGLVEECGALGRTYFPEDGSQPSIELDIELPVVGAIDILAHEMAHIVAGYDESHDEKWKKHIWI